jgi:hypothetical protein
MKRTTGLACANPIEPVKVRMAHDGGFMSTVHLQEKTATCDSVAPDTGADWFQGYAGPAASAIHAFCKTHDIVNEVKEAVALAERCFQPSSLRLAEDIDPETDDRKVVIAVTVHNKTPQEVLAAYRAFRKQMIAYLPRSKNEFIRLSYDIS